MQNDRCFGLIKHCIYQHGNAGNVIEMGMSHKNMPDRRHLVTIQLADTRAAVNQDVIVNQ